MIHSSSSSRSGPRAGRATRRSGRHAGRAAGILLAGGLALTASPGGVSPVSGDAPIRALPAPAGRPAGARSGVPPGVARGGALAADDGAAAASSCPADGRLVPAGTALQPLLDSARAGAVLCLAPGTYAGPLAIRAALTLAGPRSAVVRSDGQGRTIVVESAHAVLRGFTVDGSGQRYDKMDAAVYVHADSVEARGLAVRHALFGLVAEQSHGVVFADNDIAGDPATPVGIRGDGIRIWEVRGSRIEGNRVRDSRDIVVWYSPDNVLARNDVRRSRYANHFMYSSDCVVEDNDYRGNIVGVFVMYSHDLTLRRNVFADNTVSDGMGLGVKESGNLRVEDNLFAGDNQGLYLDTSPFRAGDSVWVRRNTFTLDGAAVTFHSSETRNVFTDNIFRYNDAQVAVEGRGNARGVTWDGNYFDDYRGYDLDGDGVGDVPYAPRSLSARLVSDHPSLRFFRGTVALGLVDVAAEVLPLLQPETLLVDPRPRTRQPPWTRGSALELRPGARASGLNANRDPGPGAGRREG